MREAGSTRNAGEGGAGGGDDSFAPDQPDDWTPAPTNKTDALDQLAARGDTIAWGNGGVFSSTTTRFMDPAFNGARNATTVEVGFPLLRAGKFRQLCATHTAGKGNGSDITYTLRINGVDTSLAVTVPSDSTSPVVATGTVPFVFGDTASIKITKAGSVGISPDDIMVVADMR